MTSTSRQKSLYWIKFHTIIRNKRRQGRHITSKYVSEFAAPTELDKIVFDTAEVAESTPQDQERNQDQESDESEEEEQYHDEYDSESEDGFNSDSDTDNSRVDLTFLRGVCTRSGRTVKVIFCP